MLPIKHSINLYLPRFQPPKLSPEILLFGKVVLITLVGLIGLSAAMFIFQTYSSNHVAQLHQEQELLNKQINKLAEQFPKISIDGNLQEKINKEKELIKRKKRAITFLRQDSISGKSSFTALVEQLSQQSVNGIWLSKIEIINQGRDVQLTGFAKTPDKVSHYIMGLGSKDAYKGKSFKQINITKNDTPWSQFFLSTKKQTRDENAQTQALSLGRNL
jgi:MSHA biogenesis protein MshI